MMKIKMSKIPMMHTILTTFCLLVFVAKGEKVVIHEIQQAQRAHRAATEGSPFLSATLLASLIPLYAPTIEAEQKTTFTTALTQFLKHVFEGQSVYNVEIISATIFDEQFVAIGDKKTHGGRKLNPLLNPLQSNQFHFIHDDEEDCPYSNCNNEGSADKWEGDDGYEDDEVENEALDVMAGILGEGGKGKDEASENEGNGDKLNADQDEWVVDESEWLPEEEVKLGTYTLKFTTVISAEHASDDQQISHSEFQDMLIHICTKFQDHLVQFIRDSDSFFSSIENVTVSALQKIDNEGDDIMFGSTSPFGVDGLSAGSIVGITVGLLVSLLILFVSVNLYKREQRLKHNKWRSQEIEIANTAGSTIKSLRVLNHRSSGDDYSFDPFGTEVPSSIYKDTPDIESNNSLRLRKTHSKDEEETVSFMSQSSEAKKSTPAHSRQEHIYAPPGKVGVAIDVINGQPTVHKIRDGSPLEGVLQHGDIIMAIDDVETSSMSAADVTHLMVKRMNYRRKISYIRPVVQ